MRLGLPAIAGVVLGISLTGKVENSTRQQTTQRSSATTKEAKLPDDLAIVRIAALAGRSTEARAKIQELVAAGAKNEEIAEWLALVLFSDPTWLDTFILTVPEDRRIALTRITIMKVGELQTDAAWELIRSSPYARMAARSDVEIEHRKGLDILGYCRSSGLTSEVILDPSLGFSDKEIGQTLRFSSGGENARRILDEWMRGRWKGDPPGFVSQAWAHFWYTDKDALQEIEKTLPPNLRTSVDQFNALNEQSQRADDGGTVGVPSAEDLSKLGRDGLMKILQSQRNSGTSIPLETFIQLPAELRKTGLENYFVQDDTFHEDMARQCVEQLDQLDLTPAEKQSLLEDAGTLSWENQGDYQTALDWATRMPDAKGRAEFEKKILTKLAQQDPQAALDYVATLPAGELRSKIEHIAMEALP